MAVASAMYVAAPGHKRQQKSPEHPSHDTATRLPGLRRLRRPKVRENQSIRLGSDLSEPWPEAAWIGISRVAVTAAPRREKPSGWPDWWYTAGELGAPRRARAGAALMHPPATTGPRRNPWPVAFAVMLSAARVVLDTTVVNVSLPHIACSLSATAVHPGHLPRSGHPPWVRGVADRLILEYAAPLDTAALVQYLAAHQPKLLSRLQINVRQGGAGPRAGISQPGLNPLAVFLVPSPDLPVGCVGRVTAQHGRATNQPFI